MSEDSKEYTTVIEMYVDGYGCDIISQKTGLTKYRVISILKISGIKLRNRIDSITKYTIDKNFFSIINTPQKAYFLGWLYSDGGISGRSIRLALKDDLDNRKILKVILDMIMSNQPIMSTTDKTGYKKVAITIYDQKIIHDLKLLGIKNNKTYNCSYPDIPITFANHFIRGFFDGDGSIFACKQDCKLDKWQVSFVGTNDFLLGVKNILDQNNIISHISNTFCDKHMCVKRLCITQICSIKRFYDFIYYNCDNMALERKKVKFEEFLAYREMIETQKCLLCNRKMFRKGFCHFHLAENKRQKDPFYTKSLKINPEIVYSLLSSGCTQKHIATILNVSRASICKFLKLRPYLKCK